MAPTPPSNTFSSTLYDYLHRPRQLTSRISITPSEFKYEGLAFLFSLVFVFLHAIGKRWNRALAQNWVQEALPVIEKEFATQAKDGEGKGEVLLWNGGDEAVLFASGRRGVESLHAHFHLTPRHDPLLYLFHTLYEFALATPTSAVRDRLTLTFQLPTTSDNTSGVFALVDKSVLQTVRKSRPFDLSFARLLEFQDQRDARGLSLQWAVMSETSDLTDGFLGAIGTSGEERRAKLGIQQVLNSPAGQYLESLILTDLPDQRPEETVAAPALSTYPRQLIMNMRVPSSPTSARTALPLLHLATNLLDALEFSYIKPTSSGLTKVRRARAEYEEERSKELQKEKKEEEEEARLKRKRDADALKLEGLSEKELIKRKELEEKRARRKQQGKVSKARG